MSVVQLMGVMTQDTTVILDIHYACLGWKDITRLVHMSQ